MTLYDLRIVLGHANLTSYCLMPFDDLRLKGCGQLDLSSLLTTNREIHSC
jgi:hypothetical protein